MQLYIFFQVINVAFRVLRQIFMSIVDRRVRYRVRTILFTSIIRQDVVFFDGNPLPIIAGIWVAFFQECQQSSCGQGWWTSARRSSCRRTAAS